jgi:hypothetical protein
MRGSPVEEPGVRNLKARAKALPPLGRALDMRGSHPAETRSRTGCKAFRGYDAPRPCFLRPHQLYGTIFRFVATRKSYERSVGKPPIARPSSSSPRRKPPDVADCRDGKAVTRACLPAAPSRRSRLSLTLRAILEVERPRIRPFRLVASLVAHWGITIVNVEL